MRRVYSNRALNLLYLFITENNLSHYSIIVPTNICHDVYFLLRYIGINTVFLDINNRGWELDFDLVQNQIKSSEKIILLWNHTYGNPSVPYDFFIKSKSVNTNLIIIDDRCLCNPANFKSTIEDRAIDLILYSTGSRKQVELGYGSFGMVHDKYRISNIYYDFNPLIYKRIKKLFLMGNYSVIDDYISKIWISVKYTPENEKNYLQKIIIENKNWLEHKENIKSIYNKYINNDLIADSCFNNWRFNLIVKNKHEIIDMFTEKGLFISSHYPSLGTIFNRNEYPEAEWLFNHILNLFIDKYYTEEMAYTAINIINKYAHPI